MSIDKDLGTIESHSDYDGLSDAQKAAVEWRAAEVLAAGGYGTSFSAIKEGLASASNLEQLVADFDQSLGTNIEPNRLAIAELIQPTVRDVHNRLLQVTTQPGGGTVETTRYVMEMNREQGTLSLYSKEGDELATFDLEQERVISAPGISEADAVNWEKAKSVIESDSQVTAVTDEDRTIGSDQPQM
ncbi:MAG: hypothetical protein WA949_23315 [Phormidesmis sp.]